MAAVGNNIEIVEGFPGAGKPVELRDTIQMLLAHGAEVRAKDAKERTALMIARARAMSKVTALLERAAKRQSANKR